MHVTSLVTGAAGPFSAVLSCRLEQGGSVGRHVQTEFPEIIVGISGDGEATVDGVAHPLGEDDAVFLPLGSVLSLVNRSETEPLRYLIVKARG